MATKPRDDEQMNSAADFDPVWEMFKNAPLDDEPLTEADKQAIKEANEDFAAGRGRSWKDIKEELGL